MPALAQNKGHRIDVHHHISPPIWVEALKKVNKTNPPIVNWSIQRTLDDMDKGGVATADNISLRCRAHNVLQAEKDFGAEHVARAIAERQQSLL